jgi:tripeptidyl-peptidase-1
MLELSFAVKQSDSKTIFDVLERVSDPKSRHYGQHLSLETVSLMTSPKRASINAVMAHLANHGVNGSCTSQSCDFITCIMSVPTANRLLDAEYVEYVHASSSVRMLSTDRYSLPAQVASHVDFVSPTTRLPTIRSAIRKANQLDSFPGGNTPSSLRTLYSIGEVEGSGATKQAATGFLKQYFKPSDLQKFYKRYYKVAAGRTIAAKGDHMGSDAGIEASLDVDYISTVGGNVTTEFWSFAGSAPDNPQNEPFLKWIQLVGSTSDEDVPHVFSTSYGEDEASVSEAYATRINVEFAKAGARGISLLFASGDDGVGSNCTKGMFDSKWPAASPYVTAVGGTEGSKIPESVADLSSGGFSYRYTQPSWQKSAVGKYLKSAPRGLPSSSKFKATGRAFPDVSAQAVNFVVENNGETLPGVAGTSAACPTFAGVIGLLNDHQVSGGKKPLGFLNPWLYQNMDALNDVTKGSNPGCSTQGFPAAVGWDPASGIGTPNYSKMVNALP